MALIAEKGMHRLAAKDIDGVVGWMDGWIGWMDWIDGLMDWMDGLDGWMDSFECFVLAECSERNAGNTE